MRLKQFFRPAPVQTFVPIARNISRPEQCKEALISPSLRGWSLGAVSIDYLFRGFRAGKTA